MGKSLLLEGAQSSARFHEHRIRFSAEPAGRGGRGRNTLINDGKQKKRKDFRGRKDDKEESLLRKYTLKSL